MTTKLTNKITTLVSIKWSLVSVIDDVRRFEPNKENLHYLFRGISKLHLEYSGDIDYSRGIYSLIESYCNVFCLTRASKKHIMVGAELSTYTNLCNNIGVKVIGNKPISGSNVYASKEYGNLSLIIFRDILCEMYSMNTDSYEVMPFLWYVFFRYVSYKIDGVDRSGNIENSSFSTVFTDSYSVRKDNKIIATYSQYSCVVAIVHYDNGLLALGHWRETNERGEGAIYRDISTIFNQNKIKSFYLIHNNPISTILALRERICVDNDVEIYLHKKPDNRVYSVISYFDGISVIVKAESHSVSNVLIPYGPSVISPRNTYNPISFQKYTGENRDSSMDLN
jgi:hypothetical protein